MRRPELEIYSNREASQIRDAIERGERAESPALILALASADVDVSNRPARQIVTSFSLVWMVIVIMKEFC